MPRYLEVAAEANQTAKALIEMVPPERREVAAQAIARLVNYGIRCAPRAVHSTVRLNAVRRSVEGLPVRVEMKKKTDPKTGKVFNVLLTSGEEEWGAGGEDDGS